MITLVTVESSRKAKTIGLTLSDRHTVMASVGHVRDLSSKETDLEPPTFELFYEMTEHGRSVLAKLKAVVKEADGVILATDPDREREAISWHLTEVLNLKDPQRVTFIVITRDKILAAFAEPWPLDMQRVYAQEIRRALDRIIGYCASPALSDATGQKIGAGRVQSSAVRLVVDLEYTIAVFKSTQHYGAELVFINEDVTSWKAQFDTKLHSVPGETYLPNDKLVKPAAAIHGVTVAEYNDSEESKAPRVPLITSTLQQVAGQYLRLKPKETTGIAQGLYDQGFITYLRTDSPNIDDEGVANVTAYAQSADLPLVDKQQKWKTKDGAQEGHEAIRPTHAEDLDCGADAAERVLYRLIWQHAAASQPVDAIYAVRTVRLAGDVEGTPVSFRATGKTLASPGQQAVYAEDTPDEDAEKDETSSNPILALVVDDALVVNDGRLLTKKTKPPVRFKLPTLVMEMEKLRTGCPSTYVAILDNITTRGYITEDKKGYLSSSSIGEILHDGLAGRFEFIEFDYTRDPEGQLDQTAEEQATYLDVVPSAWTSLDTELATSESATLPAAHLCPTCAKALRRIRDENGFFWACSDRECKTTLPDAESKPGERKVPPVLTGVACPRHGKELAHCVGISKPIKRGMKPWPYDFYSCIGLSKCDAKYNTGADDRPVFSDDASIVQEAS